jgi:hypothetical protein
MTRWSCLHILEISPAHGLYPPQSTRWKLIINLKTSRS